MSGKLDGGGDFDEMTDLAADRLGKDPGRACGSNAGRAY
jgi:hypothetical protein